jgi:hypothetical protein
MDSCSFDSISITSGSLLTFSLSLLSDFAKPPFMGILLIINPELYFFSSFDDRYAFPFFFFGML